ncbi:MAG TPA: NAD(P)H-quinone oxidoreductase [Gemmatimonadaceae bacterium]|nr:NAD(P)H-quinone oxidoreductase [Gemmatimonadaceae bacterium]
MRAIVISRPGGPEVLELRDVPRPEPAPGQVLVRIHATAVNRADLLQRAGRYPAPPGAPADIPGLEFAGEVAALGRGVTGWTPGDRVFGIASGGTYAEYAAVHEGALAAIPPSLDWASAAAVPEAFITAHDALITQAALQGGESVLIHAVGSGVGLAAVQIARWRNASAYGTTRTATKLEAAARLGMSDGVVVGEDLAVVTEAVDRWTGGRGVSVVLDLVGGAYVPAGIAALAPLGRLILVGTVAGHRAEIRLDHLLRKRATLRGTVLRSRTDAEKAAATAAFVRDVVPALADGRMQATVDRILPLRDAGRAHQIVAADENTGKVVLAVA